MDKIHKGLPDGLTDMLANLQAVNVSGLEDLRAQLSCVEEMSAPQPLAADQLEGIAPLFSSIQRAFGCVSISRRTRDALGDSLMVQRPETFLDVAKRVLRQVDGIEGIVVNILLGKSSIADNVSLGSEARHYLFKFLIEKQSSGLNDASIVSCLNADPTNLARNLVELDKMRGNGDTSGTCNAVAEHFKENIEGTEDTPVVLGLAIFLVKHMSDREAAETIAHNTLQRFIGDPWYRSEILAPDCIELAVELGCSLRRMDEGLRQTLQRLLDPEDRQRVGVSNHQSALVNRFFEHFSDVDGGRVAAGAST